MQDAILGPNGAAPSRPSRGPRSAPLTRRKPTGWRKPRVRALLSVGEPGRDRRRSPATCSSSASRSTPPTGPASYLAGEGIEVASVSDADAGRAGRRRPGQDLPPRGLRGHPRPPRRPGPARRARGPGHRPDRPRRRQRQAVRAGHRGQARRARRGDRDDRRRRRGAARGGRPQRGRRRRRRRPGPLPAGHRRAARARARSARRPGPSSRPRRSARSPPTTPRSPPTSTRSRATPSRAGSRSSSRRSTTCATARTRTSAPRSTARPPIAAATLADAARLQGDMPSFNNLLDLDAAYRIARDYTAPTVAIVKHTDPVGLASHDELVEAYRHALETDPVASFGGIVGVNRELDGATAREIAANSYEAVVAPGLQPGGARHPARQARPGAARGPARPDRGDARLRHRQPRLQARRRRAARREPRRPRRSTAASSRS